MRRRSKAEGNLPLFPPNSDWTPPKVSDLPDWSRAKIISFDSEFTDRTLKKLGCGARRGAKIAGISFMLDGDKPYYLPMRHPENNIENPVQGFRYWRDMFKKFKGILIGANAPIDLDIAHYETEGSDSGEGITLNYDDVQVWDVQPIEAYIDENQFSYSLANIAKRCNVPGKDKELLKAAIQAYGYDVSHSGWESHIPDIPAKFVAPYAMQDAAALFPIRDNQIGRIKEQEGLWEWIQTSCKVTVLLLKLRQRGIAVDFDQVDKVEQLTIEKEYELLAEIKELTGVDIGFDNCMAASRVALALEAIGIQVPQTATGLPSVTSQLLEEIKDPKKVGEKINALRKTNKIRTTFIKSIRSHETNGRIHSTFTQIKGAGDDGEDEEAEGAAFGRLASKNLNIQQVPSKGPWAKPIRSCYKADPGKLLLSSDFSAVEPRWTVYLSEKLGLDGAKALGDQYRNNPRIDPHGAMASIVYGPDFTEEQRKRAKIIVLGTTYNMGGSKLCKMHLNLPTRWLVSSRGKFGSKSQQYYFDTMEEAVKFRIKQIGSWDIREVAGEEGQAIQNKFFEGAPFLRQLVKKATEKVEATGCLRLLGGRIVHFPMKDNGEYDWAYKATNRAIQGNSAQQLLLTMLEVERVFPGFLQLTIHDEVVGSVENIAMAHKIREVMVNAVKISIPFRCDLEIGPDWGRQKLVCGVNGCLNYALDVKQPYGCELHH